jgi:hypothetical protein
MAISSYAKKVVLMTDGIPEQISSEFDRQLETLLRAGYPALAGVSTEDFVRHIEPLKARLGRIPVPANGRIPFVIVLKAELVAPESAIPLVEVRGAAGVVNMFPVKPADFKPLDGMQIPGGMAYLLADVDTGRATLNVTPANALKLIAAEERSPLTIDEGVALVTHFPQVLQDKKVYNCFSMLSSRCGDQRVPALWISYGKPRLGWCWDNNPHSWLGSASCGSRVGP